MAVMYSCCRYFSVRLGSILVALSSMIQSIILNVIALYLLHDVTEVNKNLESFMTSNSLIYTRDMFQIFDTYTIQCIKGVVVYLTLHVGTCILLIYSALKINVPCAWPFLCVEFVRILLTLFIHVTAMMLIKENILDLGLLITLCIAGFFIILGLYYQWFCVLSFCQCVKESKMERPIQSENLDLLASDFKHMTKLSDQLGRSDQQTTNNQHQLIAFRGLQAVYSLRNRDYHGYGKLPVPSPAY